MRSINNDTSAPLKGSLGLKPEVINVVLMGFLVDGDVQGSDTAAGGERGARVSREA